MPDEISVARRMLGGLWGVAVGDALGVPVEFCSRAERERDPVVDLRGYGTHHQPPGTWSDDTSLTLCTIDTLLHAGADHQALGKSFVRWLDGEIWNPHGSVFDVGITTADAIRRLRNGVAPLAAGRADENSNGNGSLMRILPVALWYADRPTAVIVEAAHQFSSLTHRHPRAQIGCAIFCLIARHLLADADVAAAIDAGWNEARQHYLDHAFATELRAYARIGSATELRRLKLQEVGSSGYVVDTLAASLWCLLNSTSFSDAALTAVNLGDDTDTTAAITGALAGLRYGLDAIPADWRSRLARFNDLDALFTAFVARIAPPPS